MVGLNRLRENKLPVWEDGMCWEDYEVKFLACMSTRSDGYDAITGVFLNDIAEDDKRSIRRIDTRAREKMKEENLRAYNDLVAILPHGRYMKKVRKTRSDVFGDNCAASAQNALKEIVKEENESDKRSLKQVFERVKKISLSKNPVEYILKLVDM